MKKTDLMNFDIQKIPIEQQICLLKASELVKEKAMQKLKEVKSNAVIDGRNTASPNESLDAVHIANFLESIRLSKRPNADVAIGYKSTLWVQLGNIAQRVENIIHIDQANGHIKNNQNAMNLWGRSYEPGWEPAVY